MIDEENKYQEVLERAKKELNACGSLDCDAARQIYRLFPELENKDDKIRKDIIWCLKHSDIEDNNPINPRVTTTVKDAIAWLEKKGEQKYDWSEEDIRNIQDIDSVLFYDSRLEEDTRTKLRNFLKSLKDKVQLQLKQKWSEKDEHELAILETYIRNRDWSDSHINRALNILKEFINRLKNK